MHAANTSCTKMQIKTLKMQSLYHGLMFILLLVAAITIPLSTFFQRPQNSPVNDLMHQSAEKAFSGTRAGPKVHEVAGLKVQAVSYLKWKILVPSVMAALMCNHLTCHQSPRFLLEDLEDSDDGDVGDGKDVGEHDSTDSAATASCRFRQLTNKKPRGMSFKESK